MNYSIPTSIYGKVKVSAIYQNYSQTGRATSFGIDIDFPELHIKKSLKSTDKSVLMSKLEANLDAIGKKYEKIELEKEKKRQKIELERYKQNRIEQVEELNSEAKRKLEECENILKHTLDIDDTVNLDSLKIKNSFSVAKTVLCEDKSVRDYVEFSKRGRPVSYEKIKVLVPIDDLQFKSRFGLISRLFRKGVIASEYKKYLEDIKQQNLEIEAQNRNRNTVFGELGNKYERLKTEFEKDKESSNKAIDRLKENYLIHEAGAVTEYIDLVLSNSEYPSFVPKSWDADYNPESKTAVVNYVLPSIEDIPKVTGYKYKKTTDEVSETVLTEKKLKTLYEGINYQICIRTIHELFESDSVGSLEAAVFNGVSQGTNPATGIFESKVIMTVLAKKEEFEQFDLSQVDPKKTFKHLKGLSAASLDSLTPVPPVIDIVKEDRRFVESKDVSSSLEYSTNLATMDWQDFEHLVRELFEREFSSSGGEVKVTQASADGGVDAVAFDPDPIKGGKIVIQAKRYTNVVGVSAVRDLYGTVMNEGATKGVLVTTSDFGPDSYNFAKDKPLSLLNGQNLLALLEKHGHEAHINIAKAKTYFKEMSKS